MPQGAHVIKAQRFGVEDFEADVLHGLGNRAGTAQLPIREDISVNKCAFSCFVVIRVGDAVVEHNSAVAQFAMHKLEEHLLVIYAKVLQQAKCGNSIAKSE